MADNPHFATAKDWKAARALLAFDPRQPSYTAGYCLQSLQIYMRDHKKRDLPVERRTLEAHYGAFVISQSRKGEPEARRCALDVSYGLDPRPATVAGFEARVYEAGPEPEPDDIDGRSPAVAVWSDGPMFYFLASAELPGSELMRIGSSLYR